MSSDPLRDDASTVHRGVQGDELSSSSDESVDNLVDDLIDEPETDAPTVLRLDGSGQAESDSPLETMENARTVIRGGSSSPPPAKRSDGLNRTPAAVAKVLLNQQLNHFLLEELIGGGGMGAVFRAHDEQLDREVAIKVIPFAGDDPDLQRRFRNEAQSAAKLDHPRIARVFDVGHQGDWYYIVFEYVRGTNIRDHVSRTGELSIDDAIFYTCQVAEALQHASDRGIVHRDVKPSNVLIDNGRNVKLVDMGLARSERMEVSQQDLTASGVTLGTFDYISPEQARDPRAADLRSDIYSLGCTLYFMLTGEPPYPGGTMLQKLLSHGNSPAPDARLLRNEISFELSAIIQKMLAKDPADRYQAASSLVADLRELAFREGHVRTQGVQSAAIRQPSAITAWIERNAPWMVAVGLLLISVGWLELSSATSRDNFVVTPDLAKKVRPSATILPTKSKVSVAIPGDVSDEKLGPNAIDAGATKEADVPKMFDADTPPEFTPPVPDELKEADAPMVGPITLPDSTETASKTEIRDDVMLDPGLELDDSPSITEFPRLIRLVGPEDAVDSFLNPNEHIVDDVATTTKLSEALEWAERYEVDRIEITTPLIYSEPVVIRRDGLVIASTVGGSKLVFQSSASIEGEREAMVTLGNNRIELDDLHFFWEVSDEQATGGSMFSMNENRMLRITDGSITIRNVGEQEGVYAFEVNATPDADPKLQPSSEDAQSQKLPLVALQLYNVIVRGQMTMIKLEHAAALQLQWDNGLIAVSQRMIETSGAKYQQSPTSSPMELSLTRLTASIPDGLVQMDLTNNGPSFPVAINREARSCVFVVNEGTPHFEVLGIDSLLNDPPLLNLRGEANVYVVDNQRDPIFSLTDLSGETDTFELSELRSTSIAWINEKSPNWTVWWSSIRSAETTLDRLVPADFYQYGAVVRGFDQKSFSEIPFESELSSENTLEVP